VKLIDGGKVTHRERPVIGQRAAQNVSNFLCQLRGAVMTHDTFGMIDHGDSFTRKPGNYRALR
jgi:hypothetical protein